METQKNNRVDIYAMVLCALFAALIAGGAFIKIPVPLVPFTLQVMFTNLAGLLLGKKRALTSVVLYILIGLSGIPVFTQGGGPAYVLQPTFGYIIGMAAGAYVCGLIVEKRGEGLKTDILAGSVNLAIIYIVGMAYLYCIKTMYLGSSISIENLLIYCCLIFLPGDFFSCVFGALVAKRLRPMMRKTPKA